jgi:hypothetical protein
MTEGYILLRIDPQIWHDGSLNYPEKIILNLIWGFHVQGKCCLVTDDWIASKFGMDYSLVREVIKMLTTRGLVNIIPADYSYPRRLSINIPGEVNPCITDEYVDPFELN